MSGKRDRSNELPRLGLSLPKQEMTALRKRALRQGTTPQRVIQDALLGLDPTPPVSVVFPAILTARNRLDAMRRRLDVVAEKALECFGTHRDATAILAALGEIHADLQTISKQLEQGL